MIKTEKQQKHILNLIFCGLSCLLFLFLSVASLFGSSVLDPDRYRQEHILFVNDNVLFNILALLLILALIFILNRLLKRARIKTLTIILLAWVTLLGGLWVFQVQSIPVADSGTISGAAGAILSGSYSLLQKSDSYYRYFPFQLGFTLVCEIVYKIFSHDNYVAMGIANVVFLDIAYLALLKLSSLIFDNKSVVRLTILLLAACLQPILFCTFIYGNIIGFALSMWAVLFLTQYLKQRKKRSLIFAALLIAVAIAVKPNYYIVLAAMCIMLIIDAVKPFRAVNIAAVILAIMLSIGLGKVVIAGYEKMADVNLGEGVPQVLWAAMGMQEGEMAPGWYNHYTIITYNRSNFDGQIASDMAWADIEKRMTYFSENPGYALSFFSEKILSQWNEPTYESIWVSKARAHSTPISGAVTAIYNSNTLIFYMNVLQLLVFTGFLTTMIFGLKRRDNAFTVIPLIIIGGFTYHLIFEAKSQYILVYFVMLIPYAANGILSAFKELRRIRWIKENKKI